MSLEINGDSCSRCHAYLFAEDDIVYCPVCGAPHHRDCYNALGHCALEQLHGTPQQYSRENNQKIEKENTENTATDSAKSINSEDTVCKMCGESYNSSYPRCPECGAPNYSRISGYENFDFLGGVPADYKLSKNVTADNAKRFVANNPQRYIPKFAALNGKNRTSWNWMAFLFPCPWMLSRKMYKNGIVAGVLSVLATLLTYPLSKAIYALGITASNYSELASVLTKNISSIGASVLAFAFLGLAFELAIRFISGFFGDYLYKKYTIESIEKINAESEDADYDYRKKGGVSLIFFMIGLLAVQYLPSILVMFI